MICEAFPHFSLCGPADSTLPTTYSSMGVPPAWLATRFSQFSGSGGTCLTRRQHRSSVSRGRPVGPLFQFVQWMFGRAPCAFSLQTTFGMGYIHCKRAWGCRCAASCGLGNSFWMCTKFGQEVIGACPPNLIEQVSCKLRSRLATSYGKLASVHDLATCATLASCCIWSQHSCSSCSMLGTCPAWAPCFC